MTKYRGDSNYLIKDIISSLLNMVQSIPKIYYVILGQKTNESKNIFGSIQEAIDSATNNTTIILGEGDHYGDNKSCIEMKSYLTIQGLIGSRIVSPLISYYDNIIFDNVTFVSNIPIKFKGDNLLFKNCSFLVKLSDCKCKFALQFKESSFIMYNPYIKVYVKKINSLTLVLIKDTCSSVKIYSPIIKVKYCEVQNLETFVINGTGTFECYSTSLFYKCLFSGYCCDHRSMKCGRCCDNNCLTHNNDPTRIRIYRAIQDSNIHAVFMSANLIIEGGSGYLDIACGGEYVYINGLIATSPQNKKWTVGNFTGLLISGFMSNLQRANEICEFTHIEEKSEPYNINILCDDESSDSDFYERAYKKGDLSN